MAAEANSFAVPEQLALGVALGGIMGRAKSSRSREEPVLGSVTQPFRSRAERKATGGPGKERKSAAHSGPPLPQRRLENRWRI